MVSFPSSSSSSSSWFALPLLSLALVLSSSLVATAAPNPTKLKDGSMINQQLSHDVENQNQHPFLGVHQAGEKNFDVDDDVQWSSFGNGIDMIVDPNEEEDTTATADSCFPFGASFPEDGSKPNVSRSDWWCSTDKQYGFLGFSHALEAGDCSDSTNQLNTLKSQFSKMKSDYGAKMVRIYAPECREESIWENILQAGIANNMGVIPMIWWGFSDDQNVWKTSQKQLYSLLQNNILAPYVFHSLAFGSEPIGDGVDGGSIDEFVKDLSSFRDEVKGKYEIPVAISEDWDRPGSMCNDDLTELGPVGKRIKQNTDLAHVHIMPYYHADLFPNANDGATWKYFENYTSFLSDNLKGQQLLLTETMWSSILHGAHDRGGGNPGENLGNFTYYWNLIGSKESCEFFKKNEMGYFFHTWNDDFEGGMGLMIDEDGDGKAKFDWKPESC